MTDKNRRSGKNAVLGLDLGRHSVKALELTRDGSALAIENCAIVDVADRESYPDAVAAVMRAGGFAAPTVAIGMAGRGTLLRIVNLPADHPDGLDAAVREEAATLLSYNIDDAFVDYHLDAGGHDRTVGAVLAAARRSEVTDRLELLAAGDIHPTIVDMELAALANALETVFMTSGGAMRGTPLCLADVGASKTLVVVSDGACHAFGEYPFGGDTLTEMIAYRLGCSIGAGEDAKLRPDARMDIVKDAMYPGLEDMASGIRACLGRFRERSGGREAATILLSGGLAGFPGVVQLLGRLAGKNAAVFDPFHAYGAGDMDPTFLNAYAHRFSVAFGLACHARD